MAIKYKRAKNPILGSNNTRHLLSLALLAGNCLSQSVGLTLQDKKLLAIMNNVSNIAEKRHPKEELDEIFLFVKELAHKSGGQVDALIIVDLIMLSVSRSKYRGFFGLPGYYVPSREFSAEDVRIFLAYLEATHKKFRTKPSTNPVAMPKKKKIAKKKKKRTEPSEKTKAASKSLEKKMKKKSRMKKLLQKKEKKREQKEQALATVMKLAEANDKVKGEMSPCCSQQLIASSTSGNFHCPQCGEEYEVEFHAPFSLG